MLLKNYGRTLELFLIFSLLFLSNSLVIAYAFWIVPLLVVIDSIFWLLLTPFIFLLLLKRNMISVFVQVLKKNWIILPFIIFSGLSTIWSVHWQVSLHRWLVLLCTILAGGYLGLRYNFKEITRILSVFGIYVLFLSSMLVFLFPDIGIMNYYIIQGAWQGLYWHKNHMGLVATFISILFLISLLNSLQSKEKNIFLWGGLYIYSLFFIYQTDSVAAYLTMILLHGLVILGLVLLKYRGKIRKIHYMVFMLVLLIASLILTMNLDHFFGVFNRNTTLTGRIPMWAYLFDFYINNRPLFGYGFNAFWYLDSHRVSTQQIAGYPDPILIADNGFIDILVNTGYIGLFLFLLFYIGVWWRSIQYAINAHNINGLFPVILMSFTLLANISWSLLFENESFFLLNMVAVLFCVSSNAIAYRNDKKIT
jgi:exopolysaccharide production protein ExoQ